MVKKQANKYYKALANILAGGKVLPSAAKEASRISASKLVLQKAMFKSQGRSVCRTCHKVNDSETVRFKVCGLCKVALYCSQACQTQDWKAGHKTDCSGNKKK
jgi:hypothetical protein